MKEYFQYLLPVVVNVIRYFLFAGGAFLVFYILFPNFFANNKIQKKVAEKKDFIREILHSMQTTLILAVVVLLILKTPLNEYTQVYTNLSDFPLWWWPVSIIVALVIHDAYFYWMHKTVHHPKLFKKIHLLHHKSVNPSPWASYSFQFAEGVLEALIIPIILMLVPMHLAALIFFGLIGFVFNVYGHLGYEIAPKWLRHSWLFEVINTSTYHNIHHAKFHGNYGLYFRVWDRIMGTEYPDYTKEYDIIQERRFGKNHQAVSFRKSIFSMFLIVMLSAVFMSMKSTSGIEGKWRDTEGGGVILIYEEDGRYFGQLIGADDPEENKKIQEHGKIILMKNFEQKNSREYCCGTIFQPREKRKIKATLVLEDDNTLRINGKYGVFKGTRIWKRQ